MFLFVTCDLTAEIIFCYCRSPTPNHTDCGKVEVPLNDRLQTSDVTDKTDKTEGVGEKQPGKRCDHTVHVCQIS